MAPIVSWKLRSHPLILRHLRGNSAYGTRTRAPALRGLDSRSNNFSRKYLIIGHLLTIYANSVGTNNIENNTVFWQGRPIL